MKIVLFTETYIPLINGVVTHVRALKSGLEKLGHEVLVVCALPEAKHHYIENGVLYCPSISFKKLYNYGVATPTSHSRYKYIKNFNPDIIHIHTEFGVGYSGTIAAKLLNIPLVYTMHTMYDDYLYYVAPKKLIKIAKKTAHAYAKILAEKATCLTGPSKKVEEFFRCCGVDKPVYVVPNPVELDKFDIKCVTESQKTLIKQKLGLCDDELIICFCGRLGKEKSVDVLLKYWSEVISEKDKCRLLIFGDGPSKDELEEYAKNLGIDNQVMFLGKILHEELVPYYAICDLYVTASLSDTNSISMLEAMAVGLPVLHIYDKLNKGQVIDGVNGFIYRNAEEMKKLIDSYKNMSYEEQVKLHQNSRESVMKYSDVELANNLLGIYNDALNIHAKTKSNDHKFSFKNIKIHQKRKKQ